MTKPYSRSEAALNLDTTSEDIPVRAILHGWDAIEKHGKLPPLWRRMREVDKLVYINCKYTERLAVMCIIHLLLRYHADQTPKRRRQLPVLLLKRYLTLVSLYWLID